jgi:hypothetical protein
VGDIKKLLPTIGVGVALFAALLALPFPAHAATDPPVGGNCTGTAGTFFSLQGWDACLPKDSHGIPQFTDLSDIWRVLIVVIEDLVKVGGYLAVGYFIWGSIKYVKSQGEPSELTQARTIITNALLGLIIVLISVAVVQFVAGTFT